MRFFRSTKPPRLFILGWDGSPLPLLRDLMARGDLPNLARLFETGSAVEMNSSLPDVSAVAWTSINTGMNPAKHGIYGFVDRKPGSRALEVMTAAHVRRRTIWQLVSEAGRRAVALNVPLSYPPQQINGVVVSDFLAPSLAKAVHPAALLPELEQLGYRIDTDPWLARQSLDAFLDDFRETATRRCETVLRLMQREEWDLFMVVFMETDRLHHFMWRYTEEPASELAGKFRDAYRHIDQLAGRILAALDGDVNLIFLSDHGFTSLYEEFYLNVWLEREGYLAFQDGAERDLANIAPGTRAYSLDPGRVYLNLAGREPGGTVSEAERDQLLAELEERMCGLCLPGSGPTVAQAVYRADDIYHGPERGRAPDLLVMPADGYDIKGSFDSTELTGRGPLVGMHKYDNATLFVRGREIGVTHASVHDVLPTACALLDLETPPAVDGRSVLAS